MISFTILICTHNGNSRLPKTIEKICGLKLSEFISAEVIIVDNASSSSFEQDFFNWFSTYDKSISFKYVYESQKGKDFALSTGIKIASGDWVIVCDDDNWLDSNFLLSAATLINKYKDLSAIGARSNPVFDSGFSPPLWFEDSALQYACGEQYKFSGYLNYRQVIWGAGSVYSKTYLDLALHTSKLLLSNRRGEDSEIFYRIILLGGKIYYSNELFFEHYMPANRLVEEKHSQMMTDDQESNIILNKYNKFIKYYFLNHKKLISIIKWNFFGLLMRFKLIKIVVDKQYLLFEIFRLNSGDNDFKKIRDFYRKSKSINLLTN